MNNKINISLIPLIVIVSSLMYINYSEYNNLQELKSVQNKLAYSFAKPEVTFEVFNFSSNLPINYKFNDKLIALNHFKETTSFYHYELISRSLHHTQPTQERADIIHELNAFYKTKQKKIDNINTLNFSIPFSYYLQEYINNNLINNFNPFNISLINSDLNPNYIWYYSHYKNPEDIQKIITLLDDLDLKNSNIVSKNK